MPPIYGQDANYMCYDLPSLAVCLGNPYRVPSRFLLNGSRANFSGMLSLGKSYTTKVQKGSDSDVVVLIWDPPEIFHMNYIDA